MKHTSGMDDLFGFQRLRVQQPAKLLPSRASYEIYSDDRLLLAAATETQAHARFRLIPQGVPDVRVLGITAAGGEPILTLITHTRNHLTEIQDPGGGAVGEIRGRYTNRHYTLADGQRQIVGKVVGDLALKHFSVTSGSGLQFAQINKTWAGFRKEVLTPSDHYRVEFTGPVAQPARLLTVMIAIVLDLTLYEPS